VTPEPLPSKRVCRPTWKVRETASNGTSSSSSDSDDDQPSPIKPVEAIDNQVPQTESVRSVYVTPPNQFGVIQEFQQPWLAAVPITNVMNTSPTTDRDIADIVDPYPNVTSFLYNLTWRRIHGVVSISDRTTFTKMLLDKRFNNEDLAGVDFPAIEKELATDIQSPWGGNGWRRSTILIEVPTGKKPTKGSRRTAASTRARNQRYNEVDPDADHFLVHKLPIHNVRTRSLTQTMLEIIQDESTLTALHWDGRKEVWQPPYHDVPPEQVWGELYTSDAFLIAERKLNDTHEDPSNPCVIAALMVWSDSTHLAQFGQAKAWPIYAYLGNQSKYTRCKPSTRSAQVVGYIPPVSDYLLGFILLFNSTL